MDDKFIAYLTPGALASAVLAFVLREWATLYDLGIKVYDIFTRDRVDAPYEVLEHDATLQLDDEKGKVAHIHRRTRVRFLQDYTIALQDFVWGDGNPVANYRITPGVVVDCFRDAERWNFLVSLRQAKNRGDVEEFVMDRTAKDAFRQDVEWLQADTWLPTKSLRLRILFPKNRPCTKAWVEERSRHRLTTLDTSRRLPDGRVELLWERKAPRRGEVFTLKWEW